jgi:hypothetical protein
MMMATAERLVKAKVALDAADMLWIMKSWINNE